MPNITYRRLPDGNITVDADGNCGKPFSDVVLIVEPENQNPGIKITSPSGIVGNNLLRQVAYDVAYGRHLDPNAPLPSVRVRWGSASTRRDNPSLEVPELYRFNTPAEANAFIEALNAADGYAEWEIIEDEPEPEITLVDGDRIRFTCDMHVGHEGTIPKGATGTYRGISEDAEQYLLFSMDADHGFLEEHYGLPNCFLGDSLCLDEGTGEPEIVKLTE